MGAVRALYCSAVLISTLALESKRRLMGVLATGAELVRGLRVMEARWRLAWLEEALRLT